MRSDDLVVIENYPNRIDAELAQGALEAAEIESILRSDNIGGQYPFIGGVELLVRADDVQRAMEVLNISRP